MTPPAAQRSPSPAPPTAPSRTVGCRSRLSHSPGKRARKVSGPIRKQDLFYRNCITIQEFLYFPLSHHFIVFPNISFIMSIKKNHAFFRSVFLSLVGISAVQSHPARLTVRVAVAVRGGSPSSTAKIRTVCMAAASRSSSPTSRTRPASSTENSPPGSLTASIV